MTAAARSDMCLLDQHADATEVTMIRVRVEYDAYNRQFKLLDREFGSMLNDGAVYHLSVPMTIAASEDGEELLCIEGKVAQA